LLLGKYRELMADAACEYSQSVRREHADARHIIGRACSLAKAVKGV
jgi:hypothetical protein